MTKTEEASCVGSVVTIEETPALEAEILSKGIGASSGIAILDKGNVYYIANTSDDLESTIGHLIDTITQVNLAFTAINASLIGPVCAPMITALDAIKALLTTLKVALK